MKSILNVIVKNVMMIQSVIRSTNVKLLQIRRPSFTRNYIFKYTIINYYSLQFPKGLQCVTRSTYRLTP